MTLFIIFFTALVSITALVQPKLMSALSFDPYLIHHKKQWYRFISSGFLHADYVHLAVNMFVLWSFGQAVEFDYLLTFPGKSEFFFLLLYFSSIIAANMSTYFKHMQNPMYRSIGASGAVSAILFVSILYHPLQPVYLYMVIKLPGIIIGILYLFYSNYASGRSQDHINHEAHYYGALYGIAFTLVFKPQIGIFFLHQLAEVFH